MFSLNPYNNPVFRDYHSPYFLSQENWNLKERWLDPWFGPRTHPFNHHVMPDEHAQDWVLKDPGKASSSSLGDLEQASHLIRA